MDLLRLCLAREKRSFPGSIEELIRNDLERIEPPAWATGVSLVDSVEGADALILLFNGEPSEIIRSSFHKALRRSMPIAGLGLAEPSYPDSIFMKLKAWSTWWTLPAPGDDRQATSRAIQGWVSGIVRENAPFPSGDDLLAVYGRTDPEPVDQESLDRAGAVFRRRGFVCLSGSLGSGKTTLARKLLVESAEEGLYPIEVISTDLDTRAVESLLTGPEDCVVFLDLDTLRRFAGLWSAYIWDLALSLMIRATESSRRLILASSAPKIEAVFETYGEAHVHLPDPAAHRGRRLAQGRSAFERLVAADPLDAAVEVLLAAFDPVVPESLFRETLLDLWERLYMVFEKRFPSLAELSLRYEGSPAGRGLPPFRRVRIDGETHLASCDATLMTAVDDAIAELTRRKDPLIHSLGEVTLSSRNARVRKAGYVLAFFYDLLDDDMKASLLHAVSREDDEFNLSDTLGVLLRDPGSADSGMIGLFDFLSSSADPARRRSLASVCAKPWIRADSRLAPAIGRLVTDPDAEVRAELMRGIAIWGEGSDQDGIFSRLLEDGSEPVRAQLMALAGSRFPRVSQQELKAINDVLSGDNRRLVARLAWGLLNRAPEQFCSEFTDLLWLILDKLPPGGRGMVARQIGGRLRYFDVDLRKALVTGLEEEDQAAVALCLLMNYSWLTAEEEDRLWNLALSRIQGDSAFASLILRYFSVFDSDRRVDLIRAVLGSEAYQGREALSQLIARLRWDLAEVTLKVAFEILSSGRAEDRSRLCWFLLWNMDIFEDEGERIVAMLSADRSPLVRVALARSVLRLGLSGPVAEGILTGLSDDPERSVRAQVGEALGRLSGALEPDSARVLDRLVSDPDSSVRVRTLRGLLDSVHTGTDERMKMLRKASSDASPGMRREVVMLLSEHQYLLEESEAAELISEFLSDPDEKTRLEAARLVTSSPALISSEAVRRRLPDLLLNRPSAGGTIMDELSTAREIQKEFLPDAPPRLESYDIEFFYSPAREIGGDYYDFFTLPEKNIGLAIGDVTGKGIPAALTMAGLKGNLGAQVQNIYSISEIVRRVNEAVCTGAEGQSLAGLFYGVLDTRSGMLTYVNAGHNPPILVKREGQAKLLTEGGLLLGVSGGAEYEHGYISLEAADVLVMYTDGITEAMDPEGGEFGLQRLVEVSLASRDLSSRQIISRILDSVNRHSAGSPRADDQTLVVVRHR